jgi:sirohydrochlorin cobaltochelatase
VAAGCTRVDLLPLFLGSGGHVRKDLPRLLDELRLRTRVQLDAARRHRRTTSVLQAMADAAAALLG